MAGRFSIVVILVFSLLGTASAQSLSEGEIAILQPAPMLVRQRLELIPRFGVTFNDPLISQFLVGGSLYYHVSERYHLGATFEWYDFGNELGGTTDSYDELIASSSTIPELAPLTMFAAAEFGWIPINGKFALFDRIITYYDMYLSGGFGVIQSVGDMHPAGTIAVGQRTFIADWLALAIELRDRIYIEPLPSRDAFTNIVTVSMGFSVFLPPSFDYTIEEPRILDWD